MILLGFLGLIGLSCACGFLRWRWGLMCLLAIGSLQDPVRKMIPGAPGFLTLSTVPIWVSVMVGAFLKKEFSWQRFKQSYPQISVAVVVFIWAIIPSAIMSMTYAPGSWQITILGVFAYFTGFSAIILGMFFPNEDGDIERLMMCYILIVAVMLIGAPMEKFGIGMSTGAVGTERLGNLWITYRTGGMLRMLSGFYRSPDIMGWHSATMIMLAVMLALRKTNWQRYLFVALAGWGGVGIILCARRKMLAGLVVFVIVFLVLFLRHRQGRRVFGVGLIAVASVGIWSYIYQKAGADTDVASFYSSTVSEAGDRFHNHAIKAAVITVNQAGVFGYGLGMAVQGAHHINVDRPNIWQEGGISKLLAEIGIPGALAFIGILFALVRSGFNVLRNVAQHPQASLYFGFGALLFSNVISAVVSAQVYGDPFIGTLLPFWAGVFLSGKRLMARSISDEEQELAEPAEKTDA